MIIPKSSNRKYDSKVVYTRVHYVLLDYCTCCWLRCCSAVGLLKIDAYKRAQKMRRYARRGQETGAQLSTQHSQLSNQEIPKTTKMTVGAPTGKTMIEMCGTGRTGMTHNTLRTSSSVALTRWALALCSCRLWSTPFPPNNTAGADVLFLSIVSDSRDLEPNVHGKWLVMSNAPQRLNSKRNVNSQTSLKG